MEENKTIERVGNYSTLQAKPEDCVACHNAKFATVLIGGLCLDCFEIKIKERQIITAIHELAIPSLEPNSFEALCEILNELCKTRHINLNLS